MQSGRRISIHSIIIMLVELIKRSAYPVDMVRSLEACAVSVFLT
jgi:hypothetical protein